MSVHPAKRLYAGSSRSSSDSGKLDHELLLERRPKKASSLRKRPRFRRPRPRRYDEVTARGSRTTWTKRASGASSANTPTFRHMRVNLIIVRGALDSN